MAKLIAWYPLHKDTNDWSTNNNHATAYGSTLLKTGIFGTGYNFDGVDDYIQTEPSEDLPSGDDSFTIMFWMKYNKLSTGRREAFSFGENSTGKYNAMDISLLSNNTVRLSHYFWNKDGRDVSTGISWDEWIHCAITFDGTTRDVYVNGNIELTDEFDGVDVGANTALALGKDRARNNAFFDGFVSDFRIYDDVLSAKEIKEISLGKYLHVNHNDENNPFADCSGFDNEIINSPVLPIYNNTKQPRNGSGCAYYTLDTYTNVMDKLVFPDFISRGVPTSFVTSFMTEDDGTSTVNGDRRILTSDLSDYFGIAINNNSASANYKKAKVTINWGSKGLGYYTDVINYGQWYQITISVDPTVNTITIYLDGELQNVYTDVGYMPVKGRDRHLLLGMNSEADANYSDEFDGYIDDFRIYCSRLSEEDVKNIYKVRASLSDKGDLFANQFIEGSTDNYIDPKTNFGGGEVRSIVTTTDELGSKAIWRYEATGGDSYTAYKPYVDNRVIAAGTPVTVTIDARMIDYGEDTNLGYMKFFIFKTGASTDKSWGFNATDDWQTFTFKYTTVSEIDRFRIDLGSGSSQSGIKGMIAEFTNPTIKVDSDEITNQIKESGVMKFDEFNEIGVTGGLKGYWNFQTDGLTELSGESKNATLHGNAVLTSYGFSSDGDAGGCTYLGGKNWILNRGEEYKENFTINVFVKPHSIAQDSEGMVFAKSGGHTGILTIGNKWVFRMPLTIATGNKTIVLASPVITTEWTMVTATLYNSELKLYVDGVLSNSTTIPSDGTYQFSTNSEFLTGQVGNDRYQFNGIVNEARIYNRALSPSEILTLNNHITNKIPMSIKENGSLLTKEIKEV